MNALAGHRISWVIVDEYQVIQEKIMDNRRFLKVKVKSLAAEARIIRKEEQRSKGALRDSLHAHRVGVVRREARATQLAYGFIRGRRYSQLEQPGSSALDWQSVERMVIKYGFVQDAKQKLKAWREAAVAEAA